MEYFSSVREARPYLRELRYSISRIGSVHTLGALHSAHGELIMRSAAENEHTIVTIYPNKIQLFPGTVYTYDLDEDAELAQECGATAVIASNDTEMYPPEYATYIDQGARASRLNSSLIDFASRGQVTGAIRWISLCRPTVSYFGMKDIEQALLVERAVADLLIDCEVRHVPCVRYRGSGAPVSSRLLRLPHERLAEVGAVYEALERGRRAVIDGCTDVDHIIGIMREYLSDRLHTFDFVYATVVDVAEFAPLRHAALPFILHCAITDGVITHFDGLCIRSEGELRHPEVIWVDPRGRPES